MGVGASLVERGYDRFYGTRVVADSRVGQAAARVARDLVFYACLLRRGDVGETVVRTDAGDHAFHVDLRDAGASRTLYVDGTCEPSLARACGDLVEPGGRVVDVGANLGYFSVLFADAVGPAGSVLALEPDPRNFDLLERNLALNGCETATAERLAARDEPGTVRLARSTDNFSRSSPVRAGERSAEAVDVEAVTLDGYLDGPVDLLKVDTAGGDLAVLRGALDTLETHRPRLVVPYAPDTWADDHRAVLDRLRALGYEPRTVDGTPLDFDRELSSDERIPNVLFVP